MAWITAPLAAVMGHTSGTSGDLSPVLAVQSLMAHQGGWDEMLMVAVPIAVFAGLLRVANQRAARIEQERRADPPEHGPQPGEETEPRNERAGPI